LEDTSDGCKDLHFSNGFIEEEVYIEQSQGFEVCERESHVFLLRKALVWFEASSPELGIHA
jgi:hypothetical protein